MDRTQQQRVDDELLIDRAVNAFPMPPGCHTSVGKNDLTKFARDFLVRVRAHDAAARQKEQQ